MTDGPLLGTRFDVEVGAVAHGGHCVARHEGRVVFVRHALPGERVTVVVTEDKGGSYCRADAVEVLAASPDRVPPPCPYAGPGRCGGCDWQHASPDAQRRLKAAVVREQLERLGGVSDLELPEAAEELAGGPLGWRTRVQFAVDGAGVPGLRKHRSHEIIPIDRCLIATEAVESIGVLGARWRGASSVEVVASSHGDRAVVIESRRAVRVPLADVAVVGGGADRGHRRVREDAAGRSWLVHADGFWQVHPAAPDALANAVLEALAPRPGESVLDLYCGVGLFAGALAGDRDVVAIELDAAAVGDARRNLREDPRVRVEAGRVEQVLARLQLGSVDLVVLDPPRSGAGAKVVREIAALQPRAVAYVACDPAALARDVRTFSGLGYQLERVRVLDAFPMTHHTESLGLLVKAR